MKILSNLFSLFILIAILIISLAGEKNERQAMELSERELFELARAIYHEARGEDALGQAAVAHVILNRVKSPLYPDTIREVVWQPEQFSFTNDGRSDRMTDPEAIEKALGIALSVSRGKIKDPTGGALHYYAHDRVEPGWSKAGYRLIVGEHTFVKLAGR